MTRFNVLKHSSAHRGPSVRTCVTLQRLTSLQLPVYQAEAPLLRCFITLSLETDEVFKKKKEKKQLWNVLEFK